MNYLVVIPARYHSSRLPGKPLIEIMGVPMIIRTYRQCLKVVPAELIVVATDDSRIEAACKAENINVIFTSSECLTGTDRVAEVAQLIEVDTYINVQGDEPIFNPKDLKKLIDVSQNRPMDVINGYCSISSEDMFRSPSTPKVVFRADGSLLYMSRAGIPAGKDLKLSKAWRQVCAYAFPRNALIEFAKTKNKTTLEEIEDIEILRFLEIGWDVQMISMTDRSIAVDNPDDIFRVESLIKKLGLK